MIKLIEDLIGFFKPGEICDYICGSGTTKAVADKCGICNCFSDNTQYSGSFIPILHEYVLIVRKDSPTAIPILMCSQKTVDIRDMPGATRCDVVAAVLEDCRGALSLAYLYEQIEPHKKAQANKWWKEKIRRTLQLNPTHFVHDGRGLWSLKKSVA